MICKPVFNPHHTSAHLLLSMLAVAVCVAPEAAADGFNSETLFVMAERALLQRRMEIRVDIIQSFVLMSLRQTGCGDKKSAAVYANRASTMAFIMGLHLDPGTPPAGSGHAKTALTVSVIFLTRYPLLTMKYRSMNMIRGQGCTGTVMFSTKS